MSQYDVGQYRIPLRHGSRRSRQRFDRRWSLTAELALDTEDRVEEWISQPDPRAVKDGWFSELLGVERIPTCWWLLIAPGAGRLLFREAATTHTSENGPSNAAITFAEADSFRQFEDIYLFVRESFGTLSTLITNDQERAITRLGALPYFHEADAIGFGTSAAQILELIIGLHLLWIRSPHDWQPTGGTPEQNLADLFAHLIYQYPVPPWLDYRKAPQPLRERDLNWLALTLFVGRGGSFYHAAEYLFLDFRGRPLFTRRGVFHLGNAPDYATVDEAVYHALILQSGGDEPALWDFLARFRLPSPMFGAAMVREVAPWLAKNRTNLAPGIGLLVIAWFCFRMEGPPDAQWQLTLRRRSVRSVLAEIRSDLSEAHRWKWCWRLPLSWNDSFCGWDRVVNTEDRQHAHEDYCGGVRSRKN